MRNISKKIIYWGIFWLLVFVMLLFWNFNNASWFSELLGGGWNLPQYEDDFADQLTKGWYVIENGNVKKDQTIRQNIKTLFYPSVDWENTIYHIIRDITLWVMIIFIVMAWASLLLNKKPEESKKNLMSLLYILLWWVFIYASNWLFGDVLNFWSHKDSFTAWQPGMAWVTDAFIWKNSVLFVILSAIKAFAFFLAIIMIVITWFKVVAAWEGEKWKKLVKWLINVVVALLIIKWVDFIYYLTADSKTFVSNAADFIINAAKVFGWIYGVVIVIMVIAAWYLYITDWWTWDNFKKASNILVNILLSALVLFAFLLIAYQIFAEFQEWWDALETATEIEQTAYIPLNNYT